MRLSDYGMSRERGFLSHYEIDEVFLPTRFGEAIDTAERLSDLLTSGRVRHWLDRLPEPDLRSYQPGHRPAALPEVRRVSAAGGGTL